MGLDDATPLPPRLLCFGKHLRHHECCCGAFGIAHSPRCSPSLVGFLLFAAAAACVPMARFLSRTCRSLRRKLSASPRESSWP